MFGRANMTHRARVGDIYAARCGLARVATVLATGSFDTSSTHVRGFDCRTRLPRFDDFQEINGTADGHLGIPGLSTGSAVFCGDLVAFEESIAVDSATMLRISEIR